MSRLRIGVLFGGRSTEHEVSILSAQSIISAMDPDRFEAVPLYIDKNGRWLVGGSLKRLVSDDAARKYVYLPPDPTQRSLVPVQNGLQPQSPSPAGGGPQGGGLPPLDVIFPVFHGLNGEDGTIQGVLELANIPYVGAGVLGSALGLDKIYMKRAFAAVGLPVVEYLSITRSKFEQDPDGFITLVEQRIGYPCFSKFANSGSSVATTKAHDRVELAAGLRLAATFDRKLLVERAVDARELEVSVLGNDEPQASVVGEVVPAHEFYDYEAKYLDEGSRLLIPAPIEAGAAEEVRAMALKAFQAVDAAGMARVDFFMERAGGRILLNELNTIPGFTRISMYPKLWEASGLAYPKLIERLVELAIERFNDKQRSQTAIDSRLLDPGDDG
ncbi:MAG TPA: D-alanine--D-alanine ligase family protein [Candidatus Dormibacteraeota bacterium]|jgi:D-alanine-D-alanine ligase|nr:D-alanine--D-alanine ligase family protein [Candidatus Dormibacteraeota bacterium]